MTTVQDIYEYLDTLCPYALAEEWDNPGINLGYKSRRVEKALLALDLSMDTILRAQQLGCQLILTHHPLIFEPIKQVNSDTAEGRRIMALAANNIAHIACHTNLDAAEGGVNDVLAELCDLKEIEPIAGLARMGRSEQSLSALIESLKARLNASYCLAVCCDEQLGRVVVCGGAGGSLLEQPELLQRGDTLITGEAKHHQALLAAESGINLLILGHYETEYPVLTPLAERLRAAFPAVEFHLMPFAAPLENL